MPISPTFPGVFVEEISSGIRTITGVATSITAFIGRARRGPVDKAVTIDSYAEFERIFGGLDLESQMSYAVRGYYQNGGQQAIIGRLYHDDGSGISKAKIVADSIIFEAASEGEWGNELRVVVDHDVSPDVADRLGLTVADLFNLTVLDTGTGVTEEYLNVSMKSGPRRVDRVLSDRSELILVSSTLSDADPRPAANPLPASGEQRFGDNTPETNYKVTTEATAAAPLDANDYIGTGKSDAKKGLYLLKQADLFNLLCLPPEGANADYPAGLFAAALTLCEQARAMFLVDSPGSWTDKDAARNGLDALGDKSRNAALFYPRIRQVNSLRDNQLEEFVPCGVVAGVMARTDTLRGVWKAPAGREAALRGVPELSAKLTSDENGELNQLGINCLRSFPVIGRVIWGSRTMRGADILADDYKYIPVRRLALYIEESLFRGTQWVVFEPNDEPLWAQIRLSVGAFMNTLFRQGAFQGTTPKQAYFVKCDSETTTQNDINQGIVNVTVGFAPLKPAEFVIIKLQQIAAEI